MQELLTKANSPSTHLNVKIFILKLLVNNPEVFKVFAQHWIDPIANYIVG